MSRNSHGLRASSDLHRGTLQLSSRSVEAAQCLQRVNHEDGKPERLCCSRLVPFLAANPPVPFPSWLLGNTVSCECQSRVADFRMIFTKSIFNRSLSWRTPLSPSLSLFYLSPLPLSPWHPLWPWSLGPMNLPSPKQLWNKPAFNKI